MIKAVRSVLISVAIVGLMLLLVKFLNRQHGVNPTAAGTTAIAQQTVPPPSEAASKTAAEPPPSSAAQVAEPPAETVDAEPPAEKSAGDEAPADAAAEKATATTEVDPPPPRQPLISLPPRSQPAAVSGPRKGGQPGPGTDIALVFGAWSRGGWTDLLAEPRDDANRLGQALIGDQVEILEQSPRDSAWSRVELVPQSLTGWVRTDHLTAGNKRLRELWRTGSRYRVIRAPGVEVEGGLFLPFGATLFQDGESAQPQLLLPDGRQVLLDPEEVRRRDDPLSIGQALQLLTEFHQVPFRKGGNTAQSMDAAGLIFLAFQAAGVEAMPREIDAIRRFGITVPFALARRGDVVFYSNYNRDLPRPVVLLDDDRRTFIEASPARGVSFGRIAQLRNRTVLDVRRYGG